MLAVPNDKPDVLLEVAFDYQRRGWSVIPIKGKKAIGLWRPLQKQAADPLTLRMLFARSGITGLAIITGSVSGGLAVRDFDKIASYKQWRQAHLAEADLLPTVETSRGVHIYGTLSKEKFIDFGDGELRAKTSHYVIAPPSIHPTGFCYKWLNELPPLGEPLPPLPESLWSHPSKRRSNSGRTQTQHTSCAHKLSSQAEKIEAAIDATMPSGPGRRHQALFDLARRLKAIDPNIDRCALRETLMAWHQKALPYIRTKDFGTTWIEFVDSWQRVARPHGLSLVTALAASQSIELSGPAAAYDGQLRSLAALCAALQAQSGEKPFFLSCRVAAVEIGVEKTTAWRMFETMQFDGVLVLISKGSKQSGKASEWRFLAM